MKFKPSECYFCSIYTMSTHTVFMHLFLNISTRKLAIIFNLDSITQSEPLSYC